MSATKQRLIARIHSLGPITVADFMSQALSQGHDSYYRNRDPLGAAGDFITAPEISQMFGELIGAWLAERWQALGQPRRVLLIELGPGRGTLLADALRATRKVAGFHQALELHLVEINATLRQTQAKAIAAVAPDLAHDLTPHWHNSFTDLTDSDVPLLLVANEFFDALPIRQLQRTERDWRERLIDIDDTGENLRYVLAPGPSPLAALLPADTAQARPGDIAELSPPSLALMQAIAERIARQRGAALIVDYGRAAMFGPSLQAVANHRRAEPLDQPGQADLSALVDFAMLARVANQSGAAWFGPVGQGAFLTALGIQLRAQALKAHGGDGAAIDAALARLIAPEQMGILFKALAVIDKDQSPPAGFT
ncbi:MAG: SAM-dependent methyltransferase [Rhodospirillales bacterium]